ncbi:MAG TPA: amidohydrolase [Phycisphaerales bacterium]|nr:amidohydrolase [Phycisphaerales bacterium]
MPSAPTKTSTSWWSELAQSFEARHDRLVKFRRRIHATPEASGNEIQTTALVAETLRENGYAPRVLANNTGVIVDLDLGAPSGTFIALRAELDCVHVDDDKQTAYASTRPGLCHACGHDAHTTIVLSSALVLKDHLADIRAAFPRPLHNLRFIFQPSEETATGARSMIQQGALNGVEAILAVHVEPFIEAGFVGLRKGPLTSSCKAFKITIKGRGGHSARPHEGIDPIPAAVNIVNMFYQLGPRSMDNRYPLSLTVSSIIAGQSFNAFPDDAIINGTLRTARVQDMENVQRRMDAVIKGVAQATGADISMEFPIYAPATDNDPELIQLMERAAIDALGSTSVQWIEVPSMGAEDFAFYQELIPGAIVRLGAAVPDKRHRMPLHSSLFDINEHCLTLGAKFLTRSALMAASSFTRSGA